MFERFETSNRHEREEMAAQLRALYRVTRDREQETRTSVRKTTGGNTTAQQQHIATRASLYTLEHVFDVLGIDYSQF